MAYYSLSPNETIANKQRKLLENNGIIIKCNIPNTTSTYEVPPKSIDESSGTSQSKEMCEEDYRNGEYYEYNEEHIQSQIQHMEQNNMYIQQQINIFNYNAQIIEQQKYQVHDAYTQIGKYQTKISEQFKELEFLEGKITEKKKELEDYEKRISYCKMITDTMSILTQSNSFIPQYSEGLINALVVVNNSMAQNSQSVVSDLTYEPTQSVSTY